MSIGRQGSGSESGRFGEDVYFPSHDKRQSQVQLPFLVRMRLRNLAYAASSHSTRTDNPEMLAVLIASAPYNRRVLGRLVNTYRAMTIGDLAPEAEDMRVPSAKTGDALYRDQCRAAGISMPRVMHKRLANFIEAAKDEGAKANVSSMTGALIVGAVADGPRLENAVIAYHEMVPNNFDHTAEVALLPAAEFAGV
jgi:hypothetical protein